MKTFEGKKVVDGVAIGTAFVYKKIDIVVSDSKTHSPDAEWGRFIDAQSISEKEILQLEQKAIATVGEDEAAIFGIHAMMLVDSDYMDNIKAIIDNSHSAEFAVQSASQEMADIFLNMDDDYMRARSADVLDIATRLLSNLTGEKASHELPKNSIIFAEDLTPSETVSFKKEHILGIAIQKGSENSHTAILAKTMGIPALIQSEFSLDEISPGSAVILDGFDSKIYYQPDDAVLSKMNIKLSDWLGQKDELNKFIGKPTITKNGKKIDLFTNIGGVDDIESVLANDAEGIGLLRSEFLYLGRTSLPSENELFASYKEIVSAMNGKEVIIRTLDIGADKQADYLNLAPEENPALGLRAIRICLNDPSIFRTQLRAILRASAFGKVSIMFPMIISLWEVLESKKILEDVKKELDEEGVSYKDVSIGIMIETPAAVMISDDLAKEVDFFSVGTNDLTQYTLAIDRQNEILNKFYDSHHPAVLKMLETIATNANKNGIWAGICGELAADKELTEKFIEMGFSELSVSPAFLLDLRRHISEINI